MEMDSAKPSQPASQPTSKGYGKRPMWQWILLYVLIGGIVYGAIYYFAVAKKGGYTAPNTNTPGYTAPTTNTQGYTPPTTTNQGYTPPSPY